MTTAVDDPRHCINEVITRQTIVDKFVKFSYVVPATNVVALQAISDCKDQQQHVRIFSMTKISSKSTASYLSTQ